MGCIRLFFVHLYQLHTLIIISSKRYFPFANEMNSNQPSNTSKTVPQIPQVAFNFNPPPVTPPQQPSQQSYNSFIPQQVTSSSVPTFQFQQNAINAPQQIPTSNFVLPPYNQQQQQYIPQQQFVSQKPFALQQKKASQPSFFPQQQQQQSYSSNAYENEQIEQIPQIYQSQIPYQNNIMPVGFSFGDQQETASLVLLNKKEQDKEKEVVAVIVTINSGGSYDHLFTSVQQKSQQGTKVLVYQASTTYIEKFIEAYKGNPADDVAKEMMEHINKLHPDCVVFNWQCCGAYSQKHFVEGKDKLFEFLKTIIDKGHMAMFSDFSLKALITDWNSDKLGPNPFFLSGQTSNPINMKFNPGLLKQCPSAQLQIIGQMAESGTCHIDVMGGTIVYSVKNDNLNHNAYKLKVLSVSSGTFLPGTQKNFTSKVGQHVGTACHVLLTYPSGGMILTSMGHWIELMKVDTSEKKLFEVAEQNFGAAYAQQMKNEYASLGTNQQKAWVSKNAVSFVQNQAPCSNMSKKMKY